MVMVMKIKKIICTVLAATTVISLSACNVSQIESPGNTQNTGTVQTDGTPRPEYTFSPINTPSEKPPATPDGRPTVKPTVKPPEYNPANGYYQYTLNPGNGKFAFAWTDECPVKSDVIPFGTSSEEVRAVKTRLSQLGFYCGGIDNSFNAVMRVALNEFQSVVGIERTNDITKETIDTLFSPVGIKNMTVTESAIKKGSLEGFTVIIDAGHGEKSIGTAEGSLVEKFFVMEVAARLQKMLETAGARVIMTRSDEVLISLSYRSAITNYILLDDLYKQKLIEIEDVQAKIRSIESFFDSENDFNSITKDIVDCINDVSKNYKKTCEDLVNAEKLYGVDSSQYESAYQKQQALNLQIQELRDRYALAEQLYYSTQMGVSVSEYMAKYNEKLDELGMLAEKYKYYRDLFQVNLNNPENEFDGLYRKTYDDDGFKIIDPELKEILDITGELCTDRYAFVSIHVNGIDNADYVRGTEIYVRTKNTALNNYGVNKYYYSNYCADDILDLANCVKNELDIIDPLGGGKASRIKDMDLFVLREINIPCFLLETGYVTSELDRLAMQTPQNRYGFAYSIYKGIETYYMKR